MDEALNFFESELLEIWNQDFKTNITYDDDNNCAIYTSQYYVFQFYSGADHQSIDESNIELFLQHFFDSFPNVFNTIKQDLRNLDNIYTESEIPRNVEQILARVMFKKKELVYFITLRSYSNAMDHMLTKLTVPVDDSDIAIDWTQTIANLTLITNAAYRKNTESRFHYNAGLILDHFFLYHVLHKISFEIYFVGIDEGVIDQCIYKVIASFKSKILQLAEDLEILTAQQVMLKYKLHERFPIDVKVVGFFVTSNVDLDYIYLTVIIISNGGVKITLTADKLFVNTTVFDDGNAPTATYHIANSSVLYDPFRAPYPGPELRIPSTFLNPVHRATAVYNNRITPQLPLVKLHATDQVQRRLGVPNIVNEDGFIAAKRYGGGTTKQRKNKKMPKKRRTTRQR